jgi:Protein of unknown function (DUF2860)
MNKIYPIVLIFLIPSLVHKVMAQDQIPETSGFSGYVLVIPGVFVVSNSLLASGAPLLDDVGSKQITSIFASPESNSAPVLPVAGELNYTFGKSKTQLFFGNKFEDILRLDVAFGLGVRQDIGDAGILVANFLITPLELKFWSDPYIEGEDRVKTALNFPGFRIRWGRIFQTGLEVTATARQYRHEDDRSGEWLVGQGRLNANEVSLLARDGDFLRFKALYKIKLKQHRLVPAFRYTLHNHQGEAVANNQLSFLVDYIYLSPKMVLDAKIIYGKRKANAIHPVYNDILEADRMGVALAALFPVSLFKSKGWNILVSAEYVDENANIDFFDSTLAGFNVGLMWRHTRQ